MPTSTLVALGCFTLLVVLMAAQAMARSRAGMGLTMVALLGAFALGVADVRAKRSAIPRRIDCSSRRNRRRCWS